MLLSFVFSKFVIEKKQGSLLQEAITLAQAGQYRNAGQKFSVYLKGRPADTLAKAYAMDCCLKMGQWDQADALAQEILKEDAENIPALLMRGEAALARRQYDAAEGYFSKVAGSTIDQPGSLRGLAFVALGKGDIKKAEEWTAKAFKIAPDDPKTMLCEAMILQVKGENDEALRFLNKAKTALGDDPNVTVTLAKIYAASGKLGEARDLFQGVLAYYPDSVEAHRGMAEIQTIMGDAPAAAASYQEILNRQPKDSEAVLALIRLHGITGKTVEAQAVAEEFLSRVSTDTAVNSAYARILIEKGEVDRALEILNGITQSDKKFLPAYVGRAKVYFIQGKPDEAIAEIRKALAMDVKYAEGHFELGKALIEKGMAYEGIQSLQKALELQPAYPHLHYYLGRGFLQGGFADIAAQELKAEVTAYPDHTAAWYDLGLAYAQAGKPEPAQEAYATVLERDPANMDAVYNLALAQAKGGETEKAAQGFEQVLSKKPQDIPSAYNLGVLLARLERLQEATGLFKKVLQLQADNLDARNHLARLYARQGDLDAAIAEYQGILQVQGLESADLAWVRLAELYVKKNDLPKAREAVEKALAINPNASLPQALSAVSSRQASSATLAPNSGLNAQEMLARADIYFEQGRMEDAQKEWESALLLDPVNKSAQQALKRLADLRTRDKAQIEQKEQKETQQEEQFSKRRQWEANIARLLKDGQALFDGGAYAEAIDKWSEVLVHDPKNSVAPLNIALARKMMAPAGQAAPEAALSKSKEAIQEALSTGDLFMNIGDHTAAIEEYQKVLDMDPANTVAKAKLIAAQQAMAKSGVSSLEAAKRGALAGKLEDKKKAKNIMGLLTQGEVKFKEASFDDAIEIWTQVLEINPANDQARERIAEARDLKLSFAKTKKRSAEAVEFTKQKALIKIKEAQLKKKKAVFEEGSFRPAGLAGIAAPAKKKLSLAKKEDALLDERYSEENSSGGSLD